MLRLILINFCTILLCSIRLSWRTLLLFQTHLIVFHSLTFFSRTSEASFFSVAYDLDFIISFNLRKEFCTVHGRRSHYFDKFTSFYPTMPYRSRIAVQQIIFCNIYVKIFCQKKLSAPTLLRRFCNDQHLIIKIACSNTYVLFHEYSKNPRD